MMVILHLEDFSCIDTLKAHLGIESRSAIIRLALRTLRAEISAKVPKSGSD